MDFKISIEIWYSSPNVNMICPLKHYNPSISLQQAHTCIGPGQHNMYTSSLEAWVRHPTRNKCICWFAQIHIYKTIVSWDKLLKKKKEKKQQYYLIQLTCNVHSQTPTWPCWRPWHLNARPFTSLFIHIHMLWYYLICVIHVLPTIPYL